ncbi:MAG: aminopeptidase N [Actinobacteria bacterium]|nr:aminopeptidase N [Actinomycetota bacterium]
MPAENLTRAEAQARSATVSNVSYRVQLDLTGEGPLFTSITEAEFSAAEGSHTWLDLIADSVREIELNGEALPVETFADSRIELSHLQARNHVRVTANARYMRSGEGLHRFVDPVDDRVYLYTQFEVADARRVFAVFEQPDIKAPMQLTVQAPENWQVVSNRPTPDPTPHGDGSATWSFEPTWPLPSYLYALVAGEYHVVRDAYEGPHGTYPLGLFCRQTLAADLDADDIFLLTKQGMEFFEDAFDYPYPFDKYDQLFVPEFNAGAMENPGAVTFHEDYYIFRSRVTDTAYESRANTILHEMAHMWFGDLVTMKWWDDLWLNESFAEWAAHHAAERATRFTHAWAGFANQRKTWAYRQDQLPSTHPIAADMVDLDAVYTNFDGITYAKGASALKQLVAFVGEEEFLAGVRAYFRRHAFGNTDFSDLLTALGESSGRDLSGWAHDWLQTSGVNLIRPDTDVDSDGNYASASLIQEPPTSPPEVAPTLRPHRLEVGLYDRTEAGELELRSRIGVELVDGEVELSELAGQPRPDLLLVNDRDLTYAKIRLDAHSMAAAIEGLPGLADPLARSLIWGAAWDMTRDAELPTSEFVALVATGIGQESDVGLVGQVLRQTLSAVTLYGDPGQRKNYAETLAEVLREACREAEPGSDHQLAYARGLIAFAGSRDIALLRGLLTGEETIPGLVVDTDVRWSLVTKLVSVGAAGEETIAAQAEQDPTAAGRRRAITARSAAPDLAAKQLAWDSALDDVELPNASLQATIAGIMQPFQGDLVRPFIERYFAALPDIARTRTQEITQLIVTGLYPTMVVDASTIERTDVFLNAQTELSPGVRRMLVEGRDSVERAVRCVARDRQG